MPYLLFLASTIVSSICLVLVFHREYEDGLIGRIALATISIVSFCRAVQIWESDFDLELTPIANILWLALTVFFARHLYRFLRWHRCGDHEWRSADPPATAGKQ